MTVTVPTWVIMVPLVVLVLVLWLYVFNAIWDRWIGPRLVRWGMYRWADKHGYSREMVDEVIEIHQRKS